MNRFKIISDSIKNGKYIELDGKYDRAITEFSKLISECSNPTEDTFRMIDQLLSKNLCTPMELFEEVVYSQNIPITSYLINLYRSYYIKNDFNDPRFDRYLASISEGSIVTPISEFDTITYLDSIFLTRTSDSTKGTLLQYIDYETCLLENLFEEDITFDYFNFLTLQNVSDITKLHKLINLKKIDSPTNSTIILRALKSNNIEIPDNILSHLINKIVENGNLEELNYLLELVQANDIEKNVSLSSFLSINSRPLDSTLLLFDTFPNFKNNLNVEEQIELLVINMHRNYKDVQGLPILKYFLENIGVSLDFYKRIILLLFGNQYIKNFTHTLDMINYLFELSGINKKEFAENIINNDPTFINFCESTKTYILSKYRHHLCFDDFVTITIKIFLNFCRSNDLLDIALIHEYYTTRRKVNYWHKCWLENPYLDDEAYVYFVKSSENYRDLIFDYYTKNDMDSHYYNEKIENVKLLNMKGLFVINDNYYIFELLKANLSGFHNNNFIVLADLYPDVFEKHKDILYNELLNAISSMEVLKKKEDWKWYSYDPYIVFEYFHNKNYNIGDNIYGMLASHNVDFMHHMNNLKDFNIYDDRVKKIFENLCYGSDEKFLVFIEKFPNFGHMITSKSLCNSATNESRNRLLFLIDYVDNNKIKFSVDPYSYYMFDDCPMDNVDILENFFERYKKQLLIF